MVRIAFLLLTAALAASAQDPFADLLDDALAPGTFRTAIGVTRAGVEIPALLSDEDLDYSTPKTRVLLVAALDGSAESAAAAIGAWNWFHSAEGAAWREDFVLSVMPVGNPHGWMHGEGSKNGSGGDPTAGYPPEDPSYSSATNPEAQHLWRWIGMHAPDLVVVVEKEKPEWFGPFGVENQSSLLLRLASRLQRAVRGRDPDAGMPSRGFREGTLVQALSQHLPADVGTVPAIGRSVESGDAAFLEPLLETLQAEDLPGPSGARLELRRRLERTPLDVAKQLSEFYGHELDSVVYIPTVALISRLRLGDLTGDPAHRADVERIVAPYVGGQSTLGDKPTSSHLPGHLIFAELYRATQNKRYLELARTAADLGFAADGSMLESMPFHNEMSDSFFMGCAILAEVGALSGERRYFEMALRHMLFMEALDLREDGLYRHSPLDEAAWGRGNGFPALGLAWSLSAIPENDPVFQPMLAAFQRHMAALVAHQDPTGAWHQVIDLPESYRELTSTSMIGFAMARGLEGGWLEGEEYEQAVARAWNAVKTRVAPNGELVDVCTGTGKQPDLRSYHDRTAILGKDDRGGAMAMLFATEMAAQEMGAEGR